jgi:hypothetical protein
MLTVIREEIAVHQGRHRRVVFYAIAAVNKCLGRVGLRGRGASPQSSAQVLALYAEERYADFGLWLMAETVDNRGRNIKAQM